MATSWPGPASEVDAPMAEINVTPLVDVFLVLLVIFMVTAPLLGSVLEVDVPEVTTAVPADRPVALIELDAEGGIAIDGDVVALEEAVERALDAAGPEGTGVFLSADRSVPHGYVISVLDALRRSGVGNVSLVVSTIRPDEETGGGTAGP